MCQHVVKPPESKHRLRQRLFTASSLTRASLSPLRPCRCRRLQPQTTQKDTPLSVDAQTASQILICPNHPQTVRPTTPSPQPISRREAPEPAPPAERARTGAKAARRVLLIPSPSRSLTAAPSRPGLWPHTGSLSSLPDQWHTMHIRKAREEESPGFVEPERRVSLTVHRYRRTSHSPLSQAPVSS